MKTLLLAATVLMLSFSPGNADSLLPGHFGLASAAASGMAVSGNSGTAMPQLTIAPVSGRSLSTIPSSPAEFAQLGSQERAPISSGLVFGLVALFILALRIMGVNHARALADHERDSHRGKAEMFRSLLAERSRR